MRKYRFTNKAVDDLTGIWRYSCYRWSENQADKYYSMLIESCRKIASDLDAGKEYPAIKEGLFGYKAGKHIIFYREMEENEIEIIRILHEQMNLKNRLRG